MEIGNKWRAKELTQEEACDLLDELCPDTYIYYQEPFDFLCELKDEGTDRDDAREIVQKIFDSWPPDDRSTTWRGDPDDSSQIIYFTGETSWGDEPSGPAFEAIKWGYLWGVWPIFGVK